MELQFDWMYFVNFCECYPCAEFPSFAQDLTNQKFIAVPGTDATDGVTVFRSGDLVRRLTPSALQCLGRRDQQVPPVAGPW